MLFIIVWSYCGYLILLLIFSALNPPEQEQESQPSTLPKIAVIIPFYNEEEYVEKKINNLKRLKYEKDKLRIYFVDGLSTDNTKEMIINLVDDMPNWHIIESEYKGKIHQVNHALSVLDKDVEIVVNTDMDTMTESDVLIRFANKFTSDSRIAVVGANIAPHDPIPIERNYWQDQNLLRIIESKVYTSSIVVAPCYAYRSFLIDSFPIDCIADDIYVAFKANTEGYITNYIEAITGSELRTPNTFSEFFSHKFRKGNAFLIELFRFFYQLPYMSGWWKVIYLTKFVQLAVIPWVLPYFLLSTISLALSGRGLFQMAFFGFLFLSVSFITTSFLMKKCRSEYLNITKSKKRYIIKPFLISNLILILVGLSYPFYIQTSNYQKTGSCQRE